MRTRIATLVLLACPLAHADEKPITGYTCAFAEIRAITVGRDEKQTFDKPSTIRFTLSGDQKTATRQKESSDEWHTTFRVVNSPFGVLITSDPDHVVATLLVAKDGTATLTEQVLWINPVVRILFGQCVTDRGDS